MAVIGTSAVAQETGTLIKHRAAQGEYRGKNAARLTMEGFAACLVSRARGRVTAFTAMRVDDPAYFKYLRRLYDATGDSCLSSGDLAFHHQIFRGAIFQALYAVEFKTMPTQEWATLPSSGYRERYGAEFAPATQSALALEQFGECVTRAKGPQVHALLNAVPASSQESALFNGLIPAFSACIPQGEKFAFSKVVLKGALAEGMYWLAKVSDGGKAGAKTAER